jgi:hypothetical protein
MVEKRERNYAREYQRRNELAQERGFKSYGQQRRYVEYTATPVRYIGRVDPEELAESYLSRAYGFDSYEQGEDRLLDIWIIRSSNRGVDEEEAYRVYKQRARGGSLSRLQIVRLSREQDGEDWNEKWSTS